MKNTIKYLSALSLLLLLGFMASCEKENVDIDVPSMEDTLTVDTLLCDLNYDLILGLGGIPLETVTVSNLTGGTAPFSYSWNTGDSTQTIVAPVAGTYSVTVTDANNCTLAKSIEVTMNMSPCDSFELTIYAFDTFPTGTKSLEPILAGGTWPYTYQWSTGENTMVAFVTTDDTYSLTVTDTNGCVLIGNITVTFDTCTSFAPMIMSTDTLGMTLLEVDVATGMAPFTYLWQDSTTNGFLEATIPGTYSVTVTDGDGCVGEDSVDL